jgi:hypothetical protein
VTRGGGPVGVLKGTVVVKIWLGLLVLGVEVVALGWMMGSRIVEWLLSGLMFH